MDQFDLFGKYLKKESIHLFLKIFLVSYFNWKMFFGKIF